MFTYPQTFAPLSPQFIHKWWRICIKSRVEALTLKIKWVRACIRQCSNGSALKHVPLLHEKDFLPFHGISRTNKYNNPTIIMYIPMYIFTALIGIVFYPFFFFSFSIFSHCIYLVLWPPSLLVPICNPCCTRIPCNNNNKCYLCGVHCLSHISFDCIRMCG